MNKKLLFIPIIFLIFINIFSFSVYIVNSKETEESKKFISSFKDRAQYDFIMFDLNNKNDMVPDIVGRIAVEKPDAVLLVGDYAINELVKFINDTPIILAMFSKLPSGVMQKKNVCGIVSNFDNKEILKYFMNVFPDYKKIGLVFNVDKSIKYAQKFKSLAEGIGLGVELGNIKKKEDIPMTVKMFKVSGVNAIWLGKDKDINKNKFFEELYKSSQKEKIPIIAISDKHKKDGVAVIIMPDIDNIGYKAGNLAIRLNNGELPNEIGFTTPDRFKILYSKELIDFYGIKIPEKIKKYSEVY